MRLLFISGVAVFCFAQPILGFSDPGQDPLTRLGFRATEGAAAGYVADRACAVCHVALYQSYQHVGMAKSFARYDEAAVIEDFGREYYHEPSQRYYQIRREGSDLIFRRYQRDGAGKPINEFETRIDWVMGSGNRARSYLYQTEWGELYMLPLGWYSEGREWGMSPGFEEKGHPGVLRVVKRQCMFCHNAFPEVPEGSDLHWKIHQFPKDLPSGTGCQRCHGPGAEHIRTAASGAPVEKIREKIVNPRKLPPEKRDSVCFQCHMLPSVTMIGARRFDRADYSFRPGERLSDYLVHVEIDELDTKRTDRFEINHHGYRFWQSRCYQESKGELACISCHNPHVKPESAAFRAEVSQVCLGCHENQRKVHAPTMTEKSDCVGCHMPTRRTRDVVLVTMTDHRIARGPFDAEELTKPITKREPIITGIDLLPFGEPPTDEQAEIYRIVSVLRALSTDDAAAALKAILVRAEFKSPTPYMDLAEAQLKLKDYAEAEKTSRYVLRHRPNFFPALADFGIAAIGRNDQAEAMEALKRAIAIQPTPEAHYNLALAALKERDFDMALEHLNAAIALRPTLYAAWMYKGRVFSIQGKLQEARKALTRSLEIEPGNEAVYVDLVKVLRRLKQHDEAERYLKVGLRVANDPSVLKPLQTAE